MLKRDLKIINKAGIHARPAGMIAQTASGFDSEIKIIKDGYEINAKSIMGIMTLAASCGTILTLIINGRDEKEAMQALVKLFEDGFGE
jgi:phosphocarrier protein